MAFLDNSGDIVLDAVLTKEGRRRLAQGDGSFRIAKFALGDDEIDYALYDLNDPSGSKYAGLEILQTPVFQAQTAENTAVKNKLISVANNDVLYMPKLKVNTNESPTNSTLTSHVVIATRTAADAFSSISQASGLINGVSTNEASDFPRYSIFVDQGINKSEADGRDWSNKVASDLDNKEFAITMDNRLLRLVIPGQSADAAFSELTSTGANIATYIVAKDVLNAENPVNSFFRDAPTNSKDASNILGPRGERLLINLAAQPLVQGSKQARTDLGFTTRATTFSALGASSNPTSDVAQIKETFVTVEGLNSGSSIRIKVTVLAHNGD